MKSLIIVRRFSSLSLNLCNQKQCIQSQVRFSASGHLFTSRCIPPTCSVRHLGLGPTGKDLDDASTGPRAGPLTKAHATELVLHLTDEERKLLLTAMEEYHSNKIKEEFEGMNNAFKKLNIRLIIFLIKNNFLSKQPLYYR